MSIKRIIKVTCEHTHLEGTLFPRFLAVTLQHFAIDSQTKNLRCYFVVICHCMSPELQFKVSGWLEVSEAVHTAPQADGVIVEHCPVLRRGWISRSLPLVVMHFFH